MKNSSDLAAILTKLDAEKYKAIIERAGNNGYHDFKFQKITGHPEYGECDDPKLQLIRDLSPYPELQDIMQEVIDGVYDDPADQEDLEEMRRWHLAAYSSDSFFIILGLQIPTKEERINWNKRKFSN